MTCFLMPFKRHVNFQRYAGKEDIDDVLLDALQDHLREKENFGDFDLRGSPDFYQIRNRVVELKERLAKHSEGNFHHLTRNCDFSFHCTREQFETFIEEELRRAFGCLDRWKEKASRIEKNCSDVLLVGGTCQMPVVGRRLKEKGYNPLLWNNSRSAVALGASIVASRIIITLRKQSSSKHVSTVKQPPFLVRQRDRLLALKDTLLDSNNGAERDNLLSREKDCEVRAGSDAYDREFALNLLSQEEDALYEIDEALKRIEQGSYGVCEMSGKPIPQARLEALPFTRYTVECLAELEKTSGSKEKAKQSRHQNPEISPESPHRRSSALFELHKSKAIENFRNGNIDAALIEGIQAHALRPDSLENSSTLIRCHLKRQDYDAAIAVANDVCEVRRADTPSLLQLARTHYECRSEPSKTVELFARLSDSLPPKDRFSYALALISNNKLEKALQVLNDLLTSGIKSDLRKQVLIYSAPSRFRKVEHLKIMSDKGF